MSPLLDCQVKDLGRVVTGHTPPTRDRKFYGVLYPLIKPTDMHIDERYIGETLESLSEIGREKYKSYLLPPNTTCVVTIGTIGKLCLTKRESFCNQAVNAILVDEAKHDPVYVYYLMKMTVPRVKALSSGTTSGRENVSKGVFESIDIRVHTFREQRRIGAILGAYDDLIENNRRRIAILEEMARMIYRHWFVNFCFLGHEKIPMVESDLGPIPENWRLYQFSELVESALGGDWGSETPTDDESSPVVVVRGTDFVDLRLGSAIRAPRRFISETSLKRRRLIEGDIIVENSVNAKTRCAGSALLVSDGMLRRFGEDSIAASFCKVFRPKNPNLASLMVLHLQRLHRDGGMSFYQNVAANGIANFQSTRFLETERIALPRDTDSIQPQLAFLDVLMSSNPGDRIYNLRATRDLLLPKLVEGEIIVEPLEPEAVPQMA